LQRTLKVRHNFYQSQFLPAYNPYRVWRSANTVSIY